MAKIDPRKKKPDSFGETLFQEEYHSVLEDKDVCINKILAILENKKLLDDDMGVRLVLDEAVTNCIRHGNKKNPDLIYKVHLFFEGKRWGVIFEDEGEGFPAKPLPDFDDPEELFKEGGRGMFLMHHYMDTVNYCASGNILEMTKTYKKKE